MTPKQALAEAWRRWGKTGAVSSRQNGVKLVGHIVLGLFFQVEGEGATWEAAFRDIEERKVRAASFDEARNQPCPECSRTMNTKIDPKTRRCSRYPTWDGTRHVCKICAEKAKETAS